MNKAFWQTLKTLIITQLKGQMFKLALKKLLGSTMAGGFRAWLIKFVITELFEEIAAPIIRAGINYIGYTLDKVHGKYLIKRIQDAREDGDQADYDRAVDNLFK